jgi:hypothetical protein
MSTTFTQAPRTEQNEGDLAFYFIVEGDNSAQEDELWSIASRIRDALTAEISLAVGKILGPQCYLRAIDIRRGSVTFWIFVGGAYTLISQYSDFAKSVREFTLYVQRLLKNMFSGTTRGFSIMGGYTAVAALQPHGERKPFLSREFITPLLVIYLILSHAALLTVLLRFLLRTTAGH